MNRTLNLWLVALVALGALGAIATSPDARADHATQVRYVGVHPIPKEFGGGTCYIEVPHVHTYTVPDAKVHYRDHDGALYFVGDPVAYGYDGPKYAYNGPHPIRVDAVVGDDHEDEQYCYIEGPHFHTYAPPPAIEADFKLDGGAYWWIGTPPKAFVDARPVYAKVNAYYTPLRYERPRVVVDAPPPGWVGVSIGIAPPVAAVEVGAPGVVGGAVIGGPGIEAHVGVALPSVDVHVGGPAVVGGVVVGGGAIVGGPPPRGVIVKEHHDNGRHRGWRH